MRVARGRILVIRGGAIGDFILTLPVLTALRERFPETHLEVLGYPHIAGLALSGGLVDRVQPIEARGLAAFFAAGGALDSQVADYFGRFDIIISYLFDPDRIFQTNVAQCSRAQFIVGPHRPNEMERLHATEIYLKPLERLAIFDANPAPRLAVNAPSMIAKRLAVHPGSGSERKNWPEENWAALLKALCAMTSIDLLLVGGEAEGKRLERLAAKLPPERVTVLRSVPLPELAVQLAGCNGFVGHDSGISHLAAALGIPVLVLWGQTQAEIWRPRGESVRLLRASKGLDGLPMERVQSELADWLKIPGFNSLPNNGESC
jgi:heptosyltransferase-3